jgi:hypothetical protein
MKNYPNRTALILMFTLTISACSKKATEVGPAADAIKIGTKYVEPADKGTITNVVKQANTTEVKLTAMNNFVKEEANKMYFKSGSSEVKNLKIGSVVLFEGYALRKIGAITESGGQIIVSTTKAKFTEYYKSAKVNYSQKMDWTATTLSKARVNIGGRLSAFKENSETNALEFSGELKGWKLGLKLSPESSGTGRKLNIDLDAKKESVAKIVAKGYISDFDAESQIDVANSRVNSFRHENSNLNGEMDVKYTFLSMKEAATIEIPLEFERTILVEGVIPVTFKLKCVLKVFPEIAVNSTCQAHLKLTYNGSQGFNYSSGGLAPDGIISDFQGILQGDTGSASSGIVGVGVGLEFPRFSVGVFGELIVPYIVNNTSVISYFESGLPFVPGPCNQTRLKLKGTAGIDMAFLGVTFSQSTDLYEREKKFEKEGSKCPATNNSKRAELIAVLPQN